MGQGGYTYILTNKLRGVLYIGVTAASQAHRERLTAASTLKTLTRTPHPANPIFPAPMQIHRLAPSTPVPISHPQPESHEPKA